MVVVGVTGPSFLCHDCNFSCLWINPVAPEKVPAEVYSRIRTQTCFRFSASTRLPETKQDPAAKSVPETFWNKPGRANKQTGFKGAQRAPRGHLEETGSGPSAKVTLARELWRRTSPSWCMFTIAWWQVPGEQPAPVGGTAFSHQSRSPWLRPRRTYFGVGGLWPSQQGNIYPVVVPLKRLELHVWNRPGCETLAYVKRHRCPQRGGPSQQRQTLMMKPGFMIHGTCFSYIPSWNWLDFGSALAYISNRGCQICVSDALFNLSAHVWLIYSQSHKSKVPALIPHQKIKAAGLFLDFTAPVGKDGIDVVYLRLSLISLTPSQARKLPKVKPECGRRDGRREGGI